MSRHKSLNPMTRRDALCRIGNGFGMMAFASLVGRSLTYAQGVTTPDGTGGAATLDYPQRVKRVIFLFMNGGCSTIDCFDPKPALEKYDGQPLPGGSIRTERRTGELMKSPFKFKKYGECGMDVSELWPHLGELADDICWVRSVYTDIPNHEPACLMVNTGANQAGRPSMGAWLTYGLGTENKSLPGFVVLSPNLPTTVGSPLWSNGFLPAMNQGTFISSRIQTRPNADGMDEEMAMDMPEDKTEKDKDGKEKKKKVVVEEAFDPKKLISFVNNPKFQLTEQRRELDLLEKMEAIDRQRSGTNANVEAVIKSMEVAYHMQTEAPEVFDVRKESQALWIYMAKAPQRVAAFRRRDWLRKAFASCRFTTQAAIRGMLTPTSWRTRPTPKTPTRRMRPCSRISNSEGSGRTRWLFAVRSSAGPRCAKSAAEACSQAGPRSQSVRVHHVAGRRSRQGRHHLRRDRRVRFQGRRKAGACSRYPRHHPVFAGHRPQKAHVSLQRSRFPAHGHGGRPARVDRMRGARERNTRGKRSTRRRKVFLCLLCFLCSVLVFAQRAPRPARPGVKEPGVQRQMSAVTPIAVFPVEGTPDWQVLTDDAVWVTNGPKNTVHRLDVKTSMVIAAVEVGKRPCSGLAWGFGSIWVPNCGDNTLSRIDTKTNRVVATLPYGPANSEGGIAASNDAVWMLTDKKGVLSRIDPATNLAVAQIR